MRSVMLVGCLLSLLCIGSHALQAAGPIRTASASIREGDAVPAVSARSFTSAARIRITENRGQIADTDGKLRPDIRYHANAGGAQLYFTQTGISLVFAQHADEQSGISEATGAPLRRDNRERALERSERGEPSVRLARMDMVFAGANENAQIVSDETLEGYSNYYYGHCPDGITHVPAYGRLIYRNIYDNIDFVFTSGVGRCKYEFVVHPGGRVGDIRLRYSGARDLAFTIDGGLAITAAFGGVREQAPLTYQDDGKEISSTFMLVGDEVGFMVGAYDRSRALVIDPWATYCGGNSEDFLFDCAGDASGFLYALGGSLGSNFPLLNAWQSTVAGDFDAVLVKYSGSGVMLWSTYFGGNSDDGHFSNEFSLAFDGSGNPVFSLSTESTNFPVSTGAYQSVNRGYNDGAIVKLSSSGTRIWATLFGGSGWDYFAQIGVDSNGNILIGGGTESPDFPVLNAYQSVFRGGSYDAVVIKLTGSGQPVWSTFLGGAGREHAQAGIAALANDVVVVVGSTSSTDFPILNAIQSTPGGNDDLFVTWFSSTGALLSSTYFGGSGKEEGNGASKDGSGNIIFAGTTTSPNYPVLNAAQPVHAGSADGFITKLSPGGAVIWSTFLGGSGGDGFTDVACGLNDAVYYCGGAPDGFPVLNAFQPVNSSLGKDAVIGAFSANGVPQWASFYGGKANSDEAYGVTALPGGDVVFCGMTRGDDLPMLNAQQPVFGGGIDHDGFVVCVSMNGQLPIPPATPTGLTATAVSPVKAVLDWNDNATNESEYVVEVNPDGGGWSVLKTVAANSVRDTVSNLIPLMSYEFRVKAVMNQLQSAYSNTAAVTMPEFAAPSMLVATPVSLSRIDLYWQDNSQFEDMFVVESSKDGSTWTVAATTSASVTSAAIMDLQPSTLWYFRVRAVENATASAWSNTATATTFDFSAPVNLVATGYSHAEVRLTWEDLSNGESGFVVEIRQGSGTWSAVDTVGANATACIIGGLQSSTAYQCRIAGIAGGILSAWSNEASASTLLYLQSPANLAATLLSETRVQLTWVDNATQESGYEVEQQESGMAWYRALTTVADVESCELGSLTPRASYRFRVRAVASGAASSYSNEVMLETRMAPAPPQNLLASAVDSRSVRITWQRGSENEDSYELQRKNPGGVWTTVASPGPGNGSVLDQGLSLATTYWYRARAINGLGESGWSNEDSATTYDIAIPEAPLLLRALSTMPTSVRLGWGMFAGSIAEGFEIEQSSTGDEGSFVHILPDAGANDREYTVSGLQPEEYYHFRVRAYNRSGASGYSNVLRVRTTSLNHPATPSGLIATSVSGVQIDLTWSTPTPSKADGFEIEQSATGIENDFVRLTPDAGGTARSYTVQGLTPNKKYYFRLRAFNQYGKSDYTDTTSAVTLVAALDQQLIAAMQGKQSLFSALENLIPEGDAEMALLRNLFGMYPRGYNEDPARALIASWWSVPPPDMARAAEAMDRYALFEQALGSSLKDEKLSPPVTGAWEISREASGAPAVLAKDACALTLAWTAQRSALGKENQYVDAAMEDLLLPVVGGAEMLLALMGANNGNAVGSFAEDAIRNKGAAGGLTTRTLLSVLNYWHERMAGEYYITATQPGISAFADKCAQVDIGGTPQAAITKRDGFLLALRDRTDALSAAYTPYAGICTGLDAAYTIGQTIAPTAEIFLQRMVQLRPRLVDGMHKAVTNANIPVERFLYITSSEDITGLDPLQHALIKAGEAIFHPELGGEPPSTDTAFHGVQSRSTTSASGPGLLNTCALVSDPVIDADRATLIALREKIVAGDAAYALREFEALRVGGRAMTAAVARAERPLLGIAPPSIYQRTDLRDGYYGALARSNLLKTRRSVLSLALADYALAPTAPKQSALIAEIDSIIGPLDGALAALDELRSGALASLITLPALVLDAADIVRDESVSPTRCRLRLRVANVGGAIAVAPQAKLSILTEGVTAQGAGSFAFTDLAVSASAGDSLDLDIPANTATVSLSAVLTSGGRVFTDRRTLPVPQTTTAVGGLASIPATCILHQNHPNPFRPSTLISFTLTKYTAVTLVVTDALGREVARLVDSEQRQAGTHSVTFDARDLPSGLYLYRLETASHILTRKMLLMR